MSAAIPSFDFSQEPELTDVERGVLAVQVRYDYCHQIIGLRRNTGNIYRILELYGSATKHMLAETTGHSWGTIDGIVSRNIHSGFLAEEDGEVFITKSGRGFLARVHRETIKIAYGQQVGYSDQLIRALGEITRGKIPSEAAEISFEKNLPFPSMY